jgi:hypothetical protein
VEPFEFISNGGREDASPAEQKVQEGLFARLLILEAIQQSDKEENCEQVTMETV